MSDFGDVDRLSAQLGEQVAANTYGPQIAELDETLRRTRAQLEDLRGRLDDMDDN